MIGCAPGRGREEEAVRRLSGTGQPCRCRCRWRSGTAPGRRERSRRSPWSCWSSAAPAGSGSAPSGNRGCCLACTPCAGAASGPRREPPAATGRCLAAPCATSSVPSVTSWRTSSCRTAGLGQPSAMAAGRAAPAVRTTQRPPASAWSARSRCVRPAWRPIRGSGTPGTTPCGPWVSPWHLLAPACPCSHHCVTPTCRPVRGSGTPGTSLSLSMAPVPSFSPSAAAQSVPPPVPVLVFVLVTPVPVTVPVPPLTRR
ncbi:uncharacterized protein C10orf95-like [Corvus hawaiiensis]|uniref:uncharacterized protein C10orf95-like n=1 Tax=Corvus hawaiiensis TaxID=134902 RepID=UPI0020197FCF|nr:uncharacterized protein C10orf95-like [Corvus hawaiiensis]